jgi:hypothetical protein
MQQLICYYTDIIQIKISGDGAKITNNSNFILFYNHLPSYRLVRVLCQLREIEQLELLMGKRTTAQ